MSSSNSKPADPQPQSSSKNDTETTGSCCGPKSVNFTGVWKLRSSENLDEFLQSEGWGWIARKAAAASSATQTIKHDDDTIKVHIKNAKGAYEYTLEIGSGKEVEFLDADKVKNVAKAEWDNDKKESYTETVILKTDKGDKEKKLQRFMKGKEMCLKITNSKGKSVTRIFAKQ